MKRQKNYCYLRLIKLVFVFSYFFSFIVNEILSTVSSVCGYGFTSDLLIDTVM